MKDYRHTWPEWWDWELELTPHLLKRMEDRGFSEADVRLMLDDATDFRASESAGRFVIAARFEDRNWEVIVEPDGRVHLLLVITAYARESR